jgi:2-methylcitrate dehydratase PrpD
MTDTALQTLARFVATVDRARHPEAAVTRAKQAFLDTIGCMYLGADADVTKRALDAAETWGAGSAPIVATGRTAPAPWAALVNGVSAHAFDLDDYTLIANDHASAVLVSAVLAASMGGEDTHSGLDVLDAYLVGLEVIFRMGEAVNLHHYKLGWHTTSTLDGFGATAAACRLWGLDESATAMALSLTTSMGSGYVSQFGTDAKPLHAGFSAKTGIVAAGLARAGATAYLGALDGAIGFGSLLVPGGEARFAESFAKLGQPWGIEEFGLGAKAYPSCGYTHRCIDAAIALHERLGIASADEVASAAASLPDFFLAILPFDVPKDRTEALFSTAYCVAVGLVTGGNRITDFLDEAVARPDMRALAGRVTVSGRAPLRPEINADPEDPDTVSVVLRDGREDTVAIPIWTGAPGRDLSQDGFEAKLRECLALSGRGDADRLADAVMNLDRSETLSPLKAVL